jgi:hypothetical protein
LFQVLALRKKHLDFTVSSEVALLNLEKLKHFCRFFPKLEFFVAPLYGDGQGGAQRPILCVIGPEKEDARSIPKPTFYFRLIKF